MKKYLSLILILCTVWTAALVSCNDEAPSPTQPPIEVTPIPIDNPIEDDPIDGDGIDINILTLENCIAFASCAETNMTALSEAEQAEITGFHNVLKASQVADPETLTEQDSHFCKQKIDKYSPVLTMCPLPSSFGTLAE